MILVLCHGNICRSPMAAALMGKHGLTGVGAAGFKEGGARSPKKMREWLLENEGIDLDKHRAIQVTVDMILRAERILYMDGGQLKKLQALWKENGLEEKKGPLENFCEPLGRYLNEPQERIGDPMFAGNKDDPRFIAIMHQLIEASGNFVKQQRIAAE